MSSKQLKSEIVKSLSNQLDAMNRLHEISTLFIHDDNWTQVLNKIVETAISISDADFGNIQLLDDKSSHLNIVAHYGFPKWWLDFWNDVQEGEGVCGTALEKGERVIVEDVEQSPIFIDTPALDIQLKAGVHAVQSTPIFSRNGEPLGMFSTHFRKPHRPDDRELQLLDLLANQVADIIERKNAEDFNQKLMIEEKQLTKELLKSEQALKKSEENYRHLLDYAPTAIYEIDFKGPSFKSFNEALINLSGYSREELLSMNPIEILDPESQKRFKERINKGLSGKEIDDEVEYGVLHKDGQKLWVILNNKPIYKDGKIVGALVVGHDITKRKKNEEDLKKTMNQLKRSNQELERFAYVSSHDLQEPLRMVTLYSQLLERRYKDRLDSDADDFIEYIVENARHMKNLIDDLLEYSRLTSQAKEYENIDLEKVLETVLSSLSMLIIENSVTVTHDSLPTVLADKNQMLQVFQNLITNSIKFREEEPPKIDISAKKNDEEWILAFKDNGIGINPEHREKIFEVFKRLHTREEYPGTGIGLSITHKIIERHGGRIWVESKPDKGSTFYFTIPIKSN